MDDDNILDHAKRIFDIEIGALTKTRDSLGNDFLVILRGIIDCKGKVVVTGIGKSGHVARKIAATMSSLGSPAFFMHPAEALHGDLGMVTNNDIVLAISYSGESEEITRLLINLKIIGAKIFSVTGNCNSTLAKFSDVVQVLPQLEEACFLRLAPTSSTTVALVYGDALAVVASAFYGFTEENYGVFHPAGSLGKRVLLRAKDVMVKDNNVPIISEKALIMDAIVEISKKGLGVVFIIDDEERIVGIITDGDLRRSMQKRIDVYNLSVQKIMTNKPFSVDKEAMAIQVLKFMRDRSINSIPVVDKFDRVIGAITLQLLIKAGLVI